MEYILTYYSIIFDMINNGEIEDINNQLLNWINSIKSEYKYIFSVIIDKLSYVKHGSKWFQYSFEYRFFNSRIGKSKINNMYQKAIDNKDLYSQKKYGLTLDILGSQYNKNPNLNYKNQYNNPIIKNKPINNNLNNLYIRIICIILSFIILLDIIYILFHSIKCYYMRLT